jgi:hypothetical protein
MTMKANKRRLAAAAEELRHFPPAQEMRVLSYLECAVLTKTSLRTFQRTMKSAPDRPPYVVISGNRKGVLSPDLDRFIKSRRRFPLETVEPPPKRPRGRPRKQPAPTEPPTAAAE